MEFKDKQKWFIREGKSWKIGDESMADKDKRYQYFGSIFSITNFDNYEF